MASAYARMVWFLLGFLFSFYVMPLLLDAISPPAPEARPLAAVYASSGGDSWAQYLASKRDTLPSLAGAGSGLAARQSLWGGPREPARAAATALPAGSTAKRWHCVVEGAEGPRPTPLPNGPPTLPERNKHTPTLERVAMPLFTACAHEGKPETDEHAIVAPEERISVDVMLKTFDMHASMAMLSLHTADMFFPNRNDFIIVLDNPGKQSEEAWASWSFRPSSRVKIFQEWLQPEKDEFKAVGGGWGLQLWSNMWSDLYTTGDYVAIMDSDSTWGTKVTPEKLFVDGKIVMRFVHCPTWDLPDMGQMMQGKNMPGCIYWPAVYDLLQLPYMGEFMCQTPIIVPRSVFPALREHVEAVHKRPFNDVLKEILHKYKDSPAAAFSQHSALGVFMYHKMRDKAFFANLTEDAYPHVGRHTGKDPAGAESTYDAYTRAVHRQMMYGACHSFSNVNFKDHCPYESPTDWVELFTFQGQLFGPTDRARHDRLFKKKRCFCDRYELVDATEEEQAAAATAA